MGGKNNRAKAHLKGRPVIRLPGQVVLATPVGFDAVPTTNPLLWFLSSVYGALTCIFTFHVPIIQDVFKFVACIFGPVMYPLAFVTVLGLGIACVVAVLLAVGLWVIEKPVALFTMLVSAFSDPTLNGTARGATGISTLACFAFGHFCSKSAWAYQEPLLNVPVPARPIWDILLGATDEMELGKHLAESAGSAGTVLQDLALVGHRDHMVDVAA